MKKKISVICASPAKPNPGMASVDLAFHSLSRRRSLAEQVDFYQLYTAEEIHAEKKSKDYEEIKERQRLPFEYQCLRGRLDDLYDSDRILFWGDFLHMAQYQEDIGSRLLKLGVVNDAAEARAMTDRYLFLTEAPDDVLKKTIIYGSTLLFNNLRHFRDAAYVAPLRRLFRGAEKVWMRDVYSALQVGHLLGEPHRINLGADCSLFLQPEDLKELPLGAWARDASAAFGKAGVFFGRSDCNPRLLGRFARSVCGELGLEAEWLPWGMTRSFKGMQKKVAGSFSRLDIPDYGGAPLPGDLYERLGRYRLVITDTYHVCVNAWRLGTPAICIGQALSGDEFSVNSGAEFAWRDKRQVFFSMYDAMDFYVYVEELLDRSKRNRRIAHLTGILADDVLRDLVVARIHTQRDLLENDLCSMIKA